LAKRLADFAHVSFFLHVAAEIIEDTNEVAIKIGGQAGIDDV
jgi:hypothetical protein